MTELCDALAMWTVYHRPSDLPGSEYVARRWIILAGGAVAGEGYLAADTLGELRAKLPPGLVRLPRSPEDDPVIVEVWI